MSPTATETEIRLVVTLDKKESQFMRTHFTSMPGLVMSDKQCYFDFGTIKSEPPLVDGFMPEQKWNNKEFHETLFFLSDFSDGVSIDTRNTVSEILEKMIKELNIWMLIYNAEPLLRSMPGRKPTQ